MDTDVSRAFGIISGLRGTRFNATQTKAELTRVWRVARRSVNGTGIVSTEKGDQVSKATRPHDASYLVIIYYASRSPPV